jgi:hypothetical protein
MIAVDGIILVISCQKYLLTRLKEINLKENYGNWKVINVIGDLFLDCDYKLEGNLLTIKCEDSYLHLFKKEVLSFKYLYEMFDIKEGILKCNDDLEFNENCLEVFLKSPKKHKINDNEYIDIDYMGRSSNGRSMINHNFTCEPDKSCDDLCIVDYYNAHQEDLNNHHHNLKDVDIEKYKKRPYTPTAIHGPFMYLSNKSCKILINHMSNNNYNIYHYDNITDSYPYTLEDCAISFILLSNNINLIHQNNWHKEMIGSAAYEAFNGTGADPDICGNIKDSPNCIAFHTNKYKYNKM